MGRQNFNWQFLMQPVEIFDLFLNDAER